MSKMSELYPQYYKDVTDLTEADVYRICDLFEVGKRDPSGATHHAIKKLLLPGVRTGGKTVQDDVKEARNTLTRRLDMWDEDERIAAERQGKAHHTAISELKTQVMGVPVGDLYDPRFEVKLERELHRDAAEYMSQLRHYQIKHGVSECGVAYMAGITPCEGVQIGNFDDGKQQQAWETVHPGDRVIDFAQRNNLRPYEVRELNPSMRNAGLYEVIGNYWHALRIK